MAAIDVDQLLSEISAESPCGTDLEYDPAFGEMERASEGKPETQMGEAVNPAQDPDWKTVRDKALDILGRSHDVRAATFLGRALLHTDGFAGFADALELVTGLLDRHWEQFHPQLDPEDHNDPTMRVNAIASLSGDQTIADIRHAPLVESRALGRFGLREVEIASGLIQAPAGDKPPPDMAAIDGAFTEIELKELQATAAAVERCVVQAQKVEAKLGERVGAGSGADMAPLVTALQGAAEVLATQLARRGVGVVSEGAGAAQSLSGEIASREDVVRMLDKACQYFERHEPTSPVPFLLRRAKRLTSMNFMEIMKDLAPGGVQQAETISGTKE